MDDLQFTSIYSFTIQQQKKAWLETNFLGDETVFAPRRSCRVARSGKPTIPSSTEFRVFLGFSAGFFATDVPKVWEIFWRFMGVKTGVFYPPTSRSSLAPLNLAPTSRSQCVSRSFQPLFNRGKTQCLSGTFNFPKGIWRFWSVLRGTESKFM